MYVNVRYSRYGEDGVVRVLDNDIKINSVGGDMKCSHNLSQVTISQLQPQHCSITHGEHLRL